MLNSVCLMGRLGADPELKTTPSGVSVTSFRLAVERSYARDGERETDWISVVAWRQTAEFAAKYFRKGAMMAVQGSLQTRQYTDREGSKRTAVEVVAEHIFFGSSKAEPSAPGGPAGSTPRSCGEQFAHQSGWDTGTGSPRPCGEQSAPSRGWDAEVGSPRRDQGADAPYTTSAGTRADYGGSAPESCATCRPQGRDALTAGAPARADFEEIVGYDDLPF